MRLFSANSAIRLCHASPSIVIASACWINIGDKCGRISDGQGKVFGHLYRSDDTIGRKWFEQALTFTGTTYGTLLPADLLCSA
jgi:hypothetical protein